MNSTEITAPRDVRELNRTERLAVIVSALAKEGYNDNQISKFLELSRARIGQVNKKVKKGSLDKYVKKARHSVGMLLEGQLVGNMKEVKGSDILTAAKMVLDRTDPVTLKTENTNIRLSVDITQEDREKYKKALGIIDAEFEVIPPKLIEHHNEDQEESDGEQSTDGSSETVQDTEDTSTPYQYGQGEAVHTVS